MRMKKDLFLKLLLLPAAAFFLAACQSDYTEEAMLKAREFTLENTRMLPENSRNYIRYATPKLQTGTIFEHIPMQLTEYDHLPRNVDYKPIKRSQLDSIVSQFVWTPPGLGYSVITIGHSRKDFAFWEPLKVILKNPVPYRVDYEKARSGAVNYVTNNMLYLTRLERVRVRTSEAEIRETQFDLEYMAEKQLESVETEWQGFLDALKKQRDRRQFSVIWPADDPKKRIVITGFGSASGLSGWKPACGMVITAAKLDEYTSGIYEKGSGVPVSPEMGKAEK